MAVGQIGMVALTDRRGEVVQSEVTVTNLEQFSGAALHMLT